jgi:LuxR family maltose regulon positive regulatory protein
MMTDNVHASRERGLWVRRPRLLDAIDAFPRQRRLLVVRAPPGFGKSIFLSELANRLSLDGWRIGRMGGWIGPEGAAALVRKLRAAIGGPAADCDYGALPGEPPFDTWRRLVDGVFSARARFALLIDDADDLFAEEHQTYLKYLLSNQPAETPVAICSRGVVSLPPQLERHAASALTLGWEVLAFSESELGQYLQQMTKVAQENVATVQRASGGWPALAQFYPIPFRSGESDADVNARRADLQAFVRDEVLGRCTRAELDILQTCSVLQELTAADCHALTGKEDGGALLQALARKAVVHEIKPGVFTMVPLLRSEIIAHFSAVKFAAVQRAYVNAAAHLVDGARYSEALSLGAEVGNCDIIVDLLTRAGWTLFRQRGHSELLSAMALVPNARIEKTPQVAVLRAWCQLFASDVDHVSAFVSSHQAQEFSAQDEFIAENIRALSRCVWARSERSEEDLLNANLAVDESDAAFLKSLTLLYMGGVQRVQGTLTRSIQTLTQGVDVAEAAASPYVSLTTRIALGQALHLTGNLHASERCYAEALGKTWEATFHEPMLGALGQVRRAQLQYELGDLEACSAALTAAEQLVDADKGARTFGLAKLERARLAWARGDTTDAELCLANVRQVAIRHKAERLLFLAKLEESRLRLAVGAVDHAELLVREAGDVIQADSADFSSADKTEPFLAFAAQALMARGAFTQARSLLAKGLQTARASNRFAHVVFLDTLMALCWLQEGSESRAIDSFESTFLRSRRHGFHQTFVDLSLINPVAKVLHLLDRRWQRLNTMEKDRENLAVLLGALGSRSVSTQPNEVYVGPSEKLSRKDVVMLFYLSRGLKNNEIAEQMSISIETVKWRLKQIYAKLYVRNRTEALARTRQLGLVN